MTVWHPDSSKKIALVSDLATMASSVDDELGTALSVRQAHSYVWADDADRSAEVDMTPGSKGIQLDDSSEWTFIGGVWKLTGGILPTFAVRGGPTLTESIPTGATVTTLSTVWGTPTINNGFASWASGVLTITRAGIYLLNAAAAFDSDPTGTRNIAIAQDAFTGTGTAFYQRITADALSGGDTVVALTTIASLAAGDTVKVAVWQTSGATITTDPSTPQQNQLAVRYLGPS